MTDERFLYVLDNGEDTIYDLLEGNVLSKNDIEDKMNELHEENQELRDMELEDRDTVFGAGKFRLEEWGKHRYHQFYDGAKELEDESVVLMLLEQSKEIEQLKEQNGQVINKIIDAIKEMHEGKRDYAESILNEALELIK